MPETAASETADDSDLLKAAFDLIAERGWGAFSLADVGRRAGRPMAEVYRAFPDRAALLRALGRRADAAMLTADAPDLRDSPAKDRLFELLMSRFDALMPYREGLRRIAGAAPRDPATGLLVLANLGRTVDWLMAAAGLETRGIRGFAAGRALGLAVLGVTRVWLEEDDPETPKTLAELDRQLDRVARFPGWTLRRDFPEEGGPAAAGPGTTASAAPPPPDPVPPSPASPAGPGGAGRPDDASGETGAAGPGGGI